MEPGTPASWQVDPTGRHEHRYWDGEQWSDTVSDGGSTSVDPYGQAPVAAAPTPPAPEPPAVTPAPVAVPQPEPAPPAVPAPPAPAPAPHAAAAPDAPATAHNVHFVSTIVAAGLAVVAIIVVVLILTNL